MEAKELLKSKYYWTNRNQGILAGALEEYFENSERGEQTRISKKLGFGKSYISQLLNGHLSFDHKESTRVELALAIGMVPLLKMVPIDEFLKEQIEEPLELCEFEPQTRIQYSANVKLDENTNILFNTIEKDNLL